MKQPVQVLTIATSAPPPGTGAIPVFPQLRLLQTATLPYAISVIGYAFAGCNGVSGGFFDQGWAVLAGHTEPIVTISQDMRCIAVLRYNHNAGVLPWISTTQALIFRGSKIEVGANEPISLYGGTILGVFGYGAACSLFYVPKV